MLFNAVNGNGPRGSQFCALQGRWRAGTLMERLTISRAVSCSPRTFALPLT
jgi:hypothetical protein